MTFIDRILQYNGTEIRIPSSYHQMKIAELQSQRKENTYYFLVEHLQGKRFLFISVSNFNCVQFAFVVGCFFFLTFALHITTQLLF